MILHKILKIDGKTVDLTGESLVLEEGAAGRGIFTVVADAPLSGVCTLDLGYPGGVARYFSGLVIRSVPVDRKQQRLTVADFSASLQARLPLSLRNVSARTALRAIAAASGVGIATGRRRIRRETVATGHDRDRRRLTLADPAVLVGQVINIYTPDGSDYAEKSVVAVDGNAITYDTPFPANPGISAETPVKITSYDTTTEPEWLDRTAGHFVTLGTGFEALRQVAAVYGIEDPAFFGQPDGSLYVGAYADAAVARCRLSFPSALFTSLSATGADCAVIPNLRPGQRIAIGGCDELRITRVTISGNNMRVNFR